MQEELSNDTLSTMSSVHIELHSIFLFVKKINEIISRKNLRYWSPVCCFLLCCQVKFHRLIDKLSQSSESKIGFMRDSPLNEFADKLTKSGCFSHEREIEVNILMSCFLHRFVNKI